MGIEPTRKQYRQGFTECREAFRELLGGNDEISTHQQVVKGRTQTVSLLAKGADKTLGEICR